MTKRWKAVLLIVLGMSLLLALPFAVKSAYHLRLLNFVGINIILVLGLNFILGYAGLLSFAQVGFFLVGAYTGAILAVDFGFSFWLALPISAAVSGVFAWIIGIPTLRLRGHYFAFATFAFAEIVRLVALNWQEFTHGAVGITGIPSPSIGSFEISSDRSFYYFILATVVLGAAVAFRLERSSFGRALFAIKEGELAAESMGIETAKVKMTAFILSAIYAGVAGALYGPLNSVISPDVFSFDVSVVVLVSLLLGGAGTIVGAIVGSVLVTLLPEWLRVLQDYYMVVYGAGIVLLMIFLPTGLLGAARALAVRWTTKPADAAT
ncbi:branched-chain amino acid ABC transporter permease [Xanthobacter sp. KR7-65]|uniref:branched-chain amino acid ABC transporter permease n=1 Tax=Xanthobacter sp. KR7-65 TaxID=3156612 RepID=UPI0032B46D5F